MVVVAGSPASPTVLERKRVQIMDASIPGSKQPFHHAVELEPVEARAYLDDCRDQSRKMALAAAKEALRKHQPVVCGMGISSARPMGTLEATLASHAAIHSAEGEFFREAIAYAVESCKLPCTRIKEKELLDHAAAAFKMSDLAARLTDLKKILGPPWTEDEKYAALAAWIALKS